MPYNLEDNSNRRIIRRIRQACQNCRRKKVRCSGSKPRCLLCLHLGQDCRYSNDGSRRTRPTISDATQGTSVQSTNDNVALQLHYELSLKVLSLESQLQNLIDTIQRGKTELNDQALLPPTELGTEEPQSSPLDVESRFASNSSSVKAWTIPVPDDEMRSPGRIEAIIDLYFQFCQNQPYSLFHEGMLRERLRSGSLPEYLVFAICAYAVRFSEKGLFGERTQEIIKSYATMAWTRIVTLWTSGMDDQNTDIHMVQATMLLSIIEFTNGYTHRAWMKIGIVTRHCQGLNLATEPDPNLPFVEKEERRRIFWSVYILDKLVSCGRQRPPAFHDRDCYVHLPCNEDAFRKGEEPDLPSSNLAKISGAETTEASPFAVAVLAASILGRCASLCFNDNILKPQNKSFWDPATAHGDVLLELVSFEARFGLREPFASILTRDYRTDGGKIDQQKSGHFLFSNIVFHFCYCLLYHPLLVWRQVNRAPSVNQSKLVQRTLDCSRSHAAALTSILQDAKSVDCNTLGSFLVYAEAVAGVIHALGMRLSPNPLQSSFNEETLFGQAAAHLTSSSSNWGSATSMLNSLNKMVSENDKYALALHFSSNTDTDLDTITLSDEDIFALLDYTVLAKTCTTETKDLPINLYCPSMIHHSMESLGNEFHLTPRISSSISNYDFIANRSREGSLAMMDWPELSFSNNACSVENDFPGWD